MRLFSKTPKESRPATPGVGIVATLQITYTWDGDRFLKNPRKKKPNSSKPDLISNFRALAFGHGWGNRDLDGEDGDEGRDAAGDLI